MCWPFVLFLFSISAFSCSLVLQILINYYFSWVLTLSRVGNFHWEISWWWNLNHNDIRILDTVAPPNTAAHFQVPNTGFVGYTWLRIPPISEYRRFFIRPRSAVLGGGGTVIISSVCYAMITWTLCNQVRCTLCVDNFPLKTITIWPLMKWIEGDHNNW